MSKAILVMDMPEYCAECPCCDDCVEVCMVIDEEIREVNGECQKPNWCTIHEIKPNMIKALRCVASQDAMKDCYRTRYNRDRKEGEPMMTCKPLPDDLSIPCPYQQDEYKTNCEDGECMGWLNEIADMLERK